jgi:type II secretory pathway component GspD/PulD (secretin)
MKRFLLLLWLMAPAAFAQSALEIIPLRHRSAEQVIPVLRPLLEPGGALSGQSNQLFVRAGPENLAQIRAALEAIDRPLRRLLISVRFDSALQSARGGVETDARISNRGSSATVRIEDSRASRTEQVDQRIQVLEGGRALISSGASRPLRQRQVVRTPGGAIVTDNTVIQDASTGFEVVPRLSGSNVFLEIAPQRESFAPGNRGAIQSERAASTVSGRLGEWLELGGGDTASARSESAILSARQRTAAGERRIWVKVEEAGN